MENDTFNKHAYIYKDLQVLGVLFLPMLPNHHLPSLIYLLLKKMKSVYINTELEIFY